MVEQDVVTESVPDVARKAYVISKLSKLERILDEADSVYRSYPDSFRETVNDMSTDDVFWIRQYQTMILAFSQMPAQLRDSLRKMLFDATDIINTCGQDSFSIPEEDRVILEGIFTLTQRMKAISKRNLVKFLASIADSEPCELKVVSTRKGTDISFRHHMDDFGNPLGHQGN